MAKNLGISDYVKEKLQVINPETAIPLRVLVKDIVERFPSVKDETSASVRVNSVLKQKAVAEKYGRIRGKDGKTYIVLASLVPPKEATIETSTETTVEVIDGNSSDRDGHQAGDAGESVALSDSESTQA